MKIFSFAPHRRSLTESERQESNWRQEVVVDNETGLGIILSPARWQSLIYQESNNKRG